MRGQRHPVAVALVLAACSSSTPEAATTTTSTTASTTTTTTTTVEPAAVPIGIRIDDRVGMPGFAEEVAATLTDPRGWEQAGFDFVLDAGDAPYTLVLAEGPDVDALCLPYDTHGLYSCQIGPVVALNADRWRQATPEWPADAGLTAYRQMLVNHEVGHLLGQHHPHEQCAAPGELAPVMAQQSTELPETGCRPNPWPLPWELECAAATPAEELAPPYEEDPVATCAAHR